MEPSADELKAMTTIGAMLRWVPLKEPVASAVLEVFGLEEADPPRALAVLSREVVDKAIMDTRVGAQVQLPLTPVQQGKVVVLWETCRLKCGLAPSQEELRRRKEEEARLELAKVQAQAATAAAAATPTADTVALKDTVSQVSEKVVEALSNEEVVNAYKNYDDVHHDEPPEEEEPSEEQLASIKALSEAKRPPAPDFVIFKPHPHAGREGECLSGYGASGPRQMAHGTSTWTGLLRGLVAVVAHAEDEPYHALAGHSWRQ